METIFRERETIQDTIAVNRNEATTFHGLTWAYPPQRFANRPRMEVQSQSSPQIHSCIDAEHNSCTFVSSSCSMQEQNSGTIFCIAISQAKRGMEM